MAVCKNYKLNPQTSANIKNITIFPALAKWYKIIKGGIKMFKPTICKGCKYYQRVSGLGSNNNFWCTYAIHTDNSVKYRRQNVTITQIHPIHRECE